MDYKEKYEAALERAREIKSKILSSHLSTESCKAVSEYIDEIIPELAESEDERIRKELVNFILYKAGHLLDEDTEHKFIAYLEKQKEQKSKEDIIGKAMSYFGAESLLDNANGLSDFEKFTAWLYCEFLRGLPKKLNQEYIKEQAKVILDAAQKELCKMPDSTKLLEMWDAEKDMLQEKDFRGDTWRIAQNAFMDGFAKGVRVEQKEQKLAEWGAKNAK